MIWEPWSWVRNGQNDEGIARISFVFEVQHQAGAVAMLFSIRELIVDVSTTSY